MRTVDLIRKKRDGHELAAAEIEFIVKGYTAGEFPDYQMSAWLIAVLLLGMRPADKKMYAVRDVTGSVESPSLICASIMSKKLAEGIDALVLDVKTGSGAFMKSEADAVHLAELMVETGERMGKKVVALITDMDQPLGRYVGNALEVVECVEVLKGAGPADLMDLSLELAAWMIYLGDAAASLEEARALSAKLIASGAAFRKFGEIVRLQGGNEKALDDLSLLPQAQNRVDIASTEAGHDTGMDCE